MGDFARVKLTGGTELKAKLAKMSEDLREGVLRSAGYAGAEVIQEAAIRFAPIYTGNVSEGHPPPGTLKKNIIVKRIEELCGDYRQTYYITVRMGGKFDPYYASWVEYGHYVRPNGMSSSAHRRSLKYGNTTATWIPAKPFIRPAYETAADEALKAMQDKLNSWLTGVK